MMADELEPVEAQLLALGSSLVGTNDQAPRIVAEVLEHIAALKRQIGDLQKRGERRKTRKGCCQ